MKEIKQFAIANCFGILIVIVIAGLIAVSCAGCGHNTGTFLMGTEAKLGFDTQNAIPSIVYIDGFTATDVSRENSGWEVEIDSVSGITREKDGSVKGIKRIKRYVGPQCNGYLMDLAKDNPQLAEQYLKAVEAFWNNKESK